MASNSGSNPLWLESLLGESPLLSTAEWEYIGNIRSQVMSEIKSKPKLSFDESKNLKKRLSIMKNNFDEVVKHLKMNRKHRQYFIGMYPKWRSFRDINVQHLRKIANLIQDERQKCQTAIFIGSCVSLIGGAVCIAAGLKSNRIAGAGGSSMVGLGALTSAGSSAMQVGLLGSRIKEAEKVIKEDEECSEHLWEWLSDSSYLQKAMDNIRFIDIEINLKQAANIFHNAFKKNRKESELEKIIKKVISQLDISPEFAEEISDIIGIFTAASVLYDNYRPLFELSFTCTKLMLQLSTAVNLFRVAVAVNQACRIKGHGEKVAAGMVWDVVNIVLVCKDWKSMSKQAESVMKAADILEKEAQAFENVFNEIQKFRDDYFMQAFGFRVIDANALVF